MQRHETRLYLILNLSNFLYIHQLSHSSGWHSQINAFNQIITLTLQHDQKWSCRREPPLSMRNSNFAHKAQKCFSGYVLPLKIYSHITSSMKKSNFGINGVADRNPLLCAECCFGMQICFWYGALLHCTIVHYLAPPWSQTDLPWPITAQNFRGGATHWHWFVTSCQRPV